METNIDRTIKNISTVLSWIDKGYFRGADVIKETKVPRYTLYSLINGYKKNGRYVGVEVENITLLTAGKLCQFYEKHRRRIGRIEKHGKREVSLK